MTQFTSPITASVRAALASDRQFGAVVPPLHLSTNFTFAGFAEPRAYDYTRSGNPTRDALGAAIAELELGAGAVITSSGMSAIALVLELLRPGQRLIVPHDCYGGSFRLFQALAEKGHFEVRFVDQTDPQALAAAFERGADMVWVETPSNPLLRIVDIRGIAALARRQGARLVVDNTFLSPALQQPLALGADLVAHSTTKYLNGHSDVVGGAVVAKDAALHEELVFWGNCIGLVGAPFDSYLTLRGLRTLHARVRQHQENAAAIVALLSDHPAVRRVHYPGLPGHPGHAIARRQQAGFGAMVSFELAGGRAAAKSLVESLRCFSLAESLGGVESLVAHPATMTHAAMTAEARARAGIGEGLIRLSVGIEAPEDLVADLSAGLNRVLLSQPAPDPQAATALAV